MAKNGSETDIFSGTVTGEIFIINHKLNYDDKCLIYFFMRKCCGKQNVGKTTGELRFRWNNYKCNDSKYIRNKDCFQEFLFRYFHSGEHTSFQVSKITLIDKTYGQNPKKREGYW